MREFPPEPEVAGSNPALPEGNLLTELRLHPTSASTK
jgi:hypothetical protein